MAEVKTINTRIVLRNDTLANWENSNKSLLKGEVALAIRSDGKYEIRFGAQDSLSSWSQLSSVGQLVIPAKNVEFLTYQEYQLSNLETTADEQTKFLLYGLRSDNAIWEAIGNAITIPNIAPIALSIENLSSTIKSLSVGLSGEIDDLKDKISSGIHFIGHVVEYGITKDGETIIGGWYKLTDSGNQIAAKNGDLIICNSIEYIWSDTQKKWDLFGDEGNYATKKYVDDAKDAAISATENVVQQVSFLSDLTAGVNTGDVGIVKSLIGSTGKYEISAYTWDADLTSWVAMNSYYSADNVIMPSNITITEKFGKYDIPSSGSRVLECAGMTIKAFINDAFAETKSGSKTTPTFTFTVTGGTGEIGTRYTVPSATLKMTGVGSYQYGPDTGITVPTLSAVVKALKSGYELVVSNDTAMSLNSTIQTATGTANAETYLSNGTSYNYHTEAYYTEGAVPKNNLSNDDPDNKIVAGSYKPTDITATFTGYYPSYWAFTTSPKSNPTAVTANNSNTVTVDDVTYTRELNNWSKEKFTTTNKWYELFYLVPAVKRSSTGWTGKDSNNLDLAVDAKTTATVTFLDGTTATYNVYVVRNAAQYSATTCTMTFN